MDQYLDWHHAGIRMGAGAYFFRKYFSGFMDKDGKWSTQEAVDESWKQIAKSLALIEKVWLSKERKGDYMFGDKPSIADLSLGGEVTSLVAFNYPLEKEYPQIHEWFHGPMMKIESFKKLHTDAVSKLQYIVSMSEKFKNQQAKM